MMMKISRRRLAGRRRKRREAALEGGSPGRPAASRPTQSPILRKTRRRPARRAAVQVRGQAGRKPTPSPPASRCTHCRFRPAEPGRKSETGGPRRGLHGALLPLAQGFGVSEERRRQQKGEEEAPSGPRRRQHRGMLLGPTSRLRADPSARVRHLRNRPARPPRQCRGAPQCRQRPVCSLGPCKHGPRGLHHRAT